LRGIVRSLMANRTDISSLSRTRKSISRTEISRRAFGGSIGAMAFVIATAGHTQPTQPGKKLGVALVGLGGYSTGELAPALREAKSCYLAGVVTGSPEEGRKWARDFRFPERNIFSYDTMAQLKNAPDIDIVYVVTPNALHARHAIAAARAEILLSTNRK
jgi:glucose-fructose oxidoreductase